MFYLKEKPKREKPFVPPNSTIDSYLKNLKTEEIELKSASWKRKPAVLPIKYRNGFIFSKMKDLNQNMEKTLYPPKRKLPESHEKKIESEKLCFDNKYIIPRTTRSKSMGQNFIQRKGKYHESLTCFRSKINKDKKILENKLLKGKVLKETKSMERLKKPKIFTNSVDTHNVETSNF